DDVVDLALVLGGRRILAGSSDTTIGVWELETGQQLRRILGIANAHGARVAVSPDGRRALFGAGNQVHLWDLEAGEQVRTFGGHTGQVQSVGFSPTGHRAVTPAGDKTVRVWELPPGRAPGEELPAAEVAELIGPTIGIIDLVLSSPDGRRILTGTRN